MSEQDEQLIAFGGEIKALGDGKVGGYLVRFTDADNPDLEGDYFTKDTDFDIDDGDKSTVYYHHGYDPHLGQRKLGKGSLKTDETGVWIEAQMKLRDDYELAIYRMAQEGKLGWSSGTLTHLAVRESKDGAYWIKSWPLGSDATMTPTPAAGPQLTSVTTLKAYQQLAETNHQETAPEIAQDSDSATVTEDVDDAGNKHMEIKMTEEVKVEEQAPEPAPEIDYGKIGEAMTKAIKPLEDRIVELEKVETNVPEAAVKGVNVVMDTEHWKYDGLGVGDLALMVGTLREAERSGVSRRGASDASIKALAMRLDSSDRKEDEGFREAYLYMKSLTGGMKSNEIAQSTLANYGDEWVGVAYGTELWRSIRVGTPVIAKQMQFAVPQPPGAETLHFPLESTDPTWYLVAQASALSANPGGVPTNTVTASKMGTAQQSRTMAKLGCRVLWTGELEEDSVVDYVSELRRQIGESGTEMLEALLINGDTATGASANINDIAGTPVGTEYWLGLNGYRKLALVTNTANSRDGGALAEEDFLETVKLMGIAGKNALQKDRVALIPDLHTYWKALELAKFNTRDVNSQMTVESGDLNRVYGYDVVPSAQMHAPAVGSGYELKANSAGKIDQDTDSNNSTGSVLAVRFDQWRPGYRRQMTIETTRIPAADSTEIVALARFGMIYRDTEASAVSYNITL